MDNDTLLAVGAVSIAGCYIAHQVTCPGSDGAILAAVCTAIGSLVTYLLVHLKGGGNGPKIPKSQ